MRRYTPKEVSFIKRNCTGRSYAELTALFNMQHFGPPVTVAQVKSFMGNNHLRTGRDGRFQPGHASHNKGMKGLCFPGSEKGHFKPGHKPWDYMPVGSERIVDGYVQVKVSDTKKPVWKRWKTKQIVIWEKTHGRKLPKGHCVLFADGNRRNFSPDNLLLVSRAELVVMNHFKLISAHKDLTRVGKTVADIKMAITDRKRSVKKRRNKQ